MSHSPDAILEMLRARGKRLTVQRRVVIEILCQYPDHLSTQQVQDYLQRRDLDLTETTVYRILQWLKEAGVVSQTDLGQKGIVYQLVGEAPHHHLVCLRCGSVTDLDDSVLAGLRDRLRREYAFEPRIEHMAFFGVCHHCRDAAAPGE